MATKKEMPTDFENLVRNGIDFLETAMVQLESDPKHSIINFYTAVEIILKAPLVLDHWSLVVSNRDLNRDKYEAGDFVSVSFEETKTRLSLTQKKPLSDDAVVAFNKIRQHRNRIVHFYHHGIDGKHRDTIKLEQATAWFELNRFVSNTWKNEFKPFISDFQRMERSLVRNNHYAQAKFNNLKPEIKRMQKKGILFETCPRCKTNAYLIEEEIELLEDLNCMVCLHNDKRLRINCPNCGDLNQYICAHEELYCRKCEQVVNENKTFTLLDQSTVRGTKDDIDAITPASCGECQSYKSVCEYSDGYLCTKCLTFFDQINRCEFCNTPMTNDAEDSYAMGCGSCDGYAGQHIND